MGFGPKGAVLLLNLVVGIFPSVSNSIADNPFTEWACIVSARALVSQGFHLVSIALDYQRLEATPVACRVVLLLYWIQVNSDYLLDWQIICELILGRCLGHVMKQFRGLVYLCIRA